MKIDLSNEEIKFIMDVLGELPTKTGAWIVLQTITTQVQKQQEFEQVKQAALEESKNV